MFQKRKKKKEAAIAESRPEKWARFFCIAQLCIAFTMICWHLGYPYLGKLFDYRWEQKLYEFVMTGENASRFKALPAEKQKALENQYQELKRQEESRDFNRKMPFLEGVWIVLAIALSIMSLKRWEGIRGAVWLLPVVAAAYAVENMQWSRVDKGKEDDRSLFPTEQVLVKEYGSAGGQNDRENLESAWRSYLAENWGEGDSARGEFYFTIARIEKRSKRVVRGDREADWLLCLYVMWNLAVAATVFYACEEEEPLLIKIK